MHAISFCDDPILRLNTVKMCLEGVECLLVGQFVEQMAYSDPRFIDKSAKGLKSEEGEKIDFGKAKGEPGSGRTYFWVFDIVEDRLAESYP